MKTNMQAWIESSYKSKGDHRPNAQELDLWLKALIAREVLRRKQKEIENGISSVGPLP